jgi:hypothetical protein
LPRQEPVQFGVLNWVKIAYSCINAGIKPIKTKPIKTKPLRDKWYFLDPYAKGINTILCISYVK